MGIGEETTAAPVEYEPLPTVTQLGPAEAALSGGRLGPVAEESGSSFTEVLQPDVGHLGPGAGGSSDAQAHQGGGQAVRRKISGGLQAVGRGLSKVRSDLGGAELGLPCPAFPLLAPAPPTPRCLVHKLPCLTSKCRLRQS